MPRPVPPKLRGLKRLNPFQNLPNPREVWAWGMYDLANQSFTLLIITLLFSLYFKEVIVADPDRGDALWAVVHSTSLFLVVLVAPVLGAMADSRQWRKQMLLGTGLVCVAFTCALAGLGPGSILLAALIYIPANFAYQLGENFLASFLPDVSDSRNIGRVSATGWAMGYIGALCLLILVGIGMLLFGLGATESWRPFFVFAGLWFLAGMIPAALFLKERKRETIFQGNLIVESFTRLATTARRAWDYRQLAVFLVAFLIYTLGVQTVIAFASIIASDFGIRDRHLVLFVLQLTVTAGIASVITARYQDRIGARNTIIFYLGIWIASALGMFFITILPDKPQWAFWIIGNGVGFALGGIGTSSRSLAGRFTPRHRAAEFFNLWGMTARLSAALGVLMFGLTKDYIGNATAMLLLTSFFVVGLIIILFVNETHGVRAARRAERLEIKRNAENNEPKDKNDRPNDSAAEPEQADGKPDSSA